MIRIVGVQRSEDPREEFVLLQNQGSMRIQLRGHALISERALSEADLSLGHLLIDDTAVPPGMYVLVMTGVGEPRWGKTKEGALVFYTYMNQADSLWFRCPGPIHLQHTQHSYCERPAGLLLK